MPKLDAYISQRGLPEKTNNPQIPTGLGTGVYDALTQGAGQVAHDATYLLTLEQYRENRMKEVEQTNSAGQVLMGARTATLGLANRLRDPNDADFSSLTPVEKKATFNTEIQKFYQEALNQGKQIGNIGFSYVSTHLPAYLSTHIEGFNKEMDGLRHETDKFNLGQRIQDARDLAISSVERENADYHLGEMAGLIRQGVGAGLFTADEGAKRLKEESLYAKKNRVIAAASNNPEQFLLQGGDDQLKDIMNPTDYNDTLGQIRQNLSDKQSKVDRDRQEADRLRKQVYGENRKQGEVAIMQGEINNEADLVTFEKGAHLDAEGLAHLRVFIHQKVTEPAITDTTQGPKMWGSLDSMDPSKWTTIPQVRDMVRHGKMNYKEGIELIQTIGKKHEKWADKALTVYHKNATEGEQTVSQLMDPFAGGPLDMDKLGAGFKAMALQEYRDKVAKGESDPAGPNPLDVASEVSATYYKSLARQGKVLWDKSEVARSLPLPGGGKIDTMEKLNKARGEGTVTNDQYLQASRWLKLLDAVAAGLEEEALSKPKKPAGATEGGRGRAKR